MDEFWTLKRQFTHHEQDALHFGSQVVDCIEHTQRYNTISLFENLRPNHDIKQ
jgi:hypothetical protein